MTKAEYARKWREKHPGASYQATREWRQKNRAARRAQLRRENERRYRQNPHERWKNRLAQIYGMTPEMYDDMFEKQNGGCAICAKLPKATRRLVVDHDHTTGRVRGLLCDGCNLLVGHLERPIRAAADLYLAQN